MALDARDVPTSHVVGYAMRVVTTAGDDAALLARLRAGDEAAFTELVSRHHAMLVRLARTWVADIATAEEVVQDSWLSAIDALDSFEGRSKLGTWLAKIVVNKSKTRAARERRSVAVPSFEPDGIDDVERAQFDRLGFWKQPPVAIGGAPDAALTDKEFMAALAAALEALPAAQRAVVIMRDVEGCDAEEACNVLGVSESNQRVLLHRARTRLRLALEPHFAAGKDGKQRSTESR